MFSWMIRRLLRAFGSAGVLPSHIVHGLGSYRVSHQADGSYTASQTGKGAL